MIKLFSKYNKVVCLLLLSIFYTEFLMAGYVGLLRNTNNNGAINSSHRTVFPVQTTHPFPAKEQVSTAVKKGISRENKTSLALQGSGPTQPEMQAFQSVNSNNMVDLFSGDFSYNIPLMDVGGYPVNIAYRSGISMDQDASWVGLGWNINPGTITRNMRGLPDDFNGGDDVIKKTFSQKENKTVGVNGGLGVELTGLPLNVGVNAGFFKNSYRGWGMETGVNASINAGRFAVGTLTGALSLSNNSQDGVSINPSLTYAIAKDDVQNKGGTEGSLTLGLPYSSRAGLRGLQLSLGMKQYALSETDQKHNSSTGLSSMISFASPTYTPSIQHVLKNTQATFTAKIGDEWFGLHGNAFLSGYISRQTIEKEDTLQIIPAYGYLNYQNAVGISNALLDFNREKEIPFRSKPAIPNIGVPSYTYDAFSISGEGTGGMFRAYRGDIGYVYDHYIKSKDNSTSLSVDLGLGNTFHAGVDLNLTRAYTETGPWVTENAISKNIYFRKPDGLFEASYFRNPGEKSVNSKAFYDAIGGDDVVTVKLNKNGGSMVATNILRRYKGNEEVGTSLLNNQNAIRNQRDKRAQTISYLSAQEASVVGLNKYIENYKVNQYELKNCNNSISDDVESDGIGLWGEYFNKEKGFVNKIFERNDTLINFSNYRLDGLSNGKHYPWVFQPGVGPHQFTVRWTGRIKAPATGTYTFSIISDDGAQLFINDSSVINQWTWQSATKGEGKLNLVAGEYYNIRLEFFEGNENNVIDLAWSYPGQERQIIPTKYLYHLPSVDTLAVSNTLSLEKRINTFRKSSHISEIDVLNPDGRRYIYGIPVYNLYQKDATFSVNAAGGSLKDGLVKYVPGIDNTTKNDKGINNYFSSEEIPAYAHSFLLTGILSPDYVDLTGDGISDDDPGDAIRFNYSKASGVNNAYQWRAPYIKDSATYNEGFRSDRRDDKGNYIYGKKELWYLNAIVSKTMIATFKVSDREDLLAIDENGNKMKNGLAKKLDEINLYSKADFLKYGTNAKPVKTVHFEYTYELCAGINRPVNNLGKLTLKKIWFTYNGNNKGIQNPYVFNYNKNNPGYNIKSYDRWGNYKDPLQNPQSTSADLITNAEYPYALQDSILAGYNAAAWTLDSIKLPSGSKIKVEYESDDYAFVQDRRAMQMFNIVGLSSSQPSSLTDAKPYLYTSNNDNPLYVTVNVNSPVNNKQDVFNKYLKGVEKTYFRLSVKMPSDASGSGYENVPVYAAPDLNGGYGYLNANTIWFKIKSIDDKGNEGKGVVSPLTKAAIQFLKLNLPGKAYPGSEDNNDLGLESAVRMLFAQRDNIKSMFEGFDNFTKSSGRASIIDTKRSFVRLNTPAYKKYGGGLRVKRITIYDNWNAMTGRRESTYGQEYNYTTTENINGVSTTISSGVASYEPMLGNEENPFRVPVEYVERIAPLAPVTLGYTEEPLGESFFPSASVGYRKVSVRSIHIANTRSANGYDESTFFTAYEYPVFTERTLITDDNRPIYNPALSKLLRINAKNYVAVSQGFKVELNDMTGKMRSQASYAQNGDVITYTENFYKTENDFLQTKKLDNTVWAIAADGSIDTAALIGKDAEIMMDMRRQFTRTNAPNYNLNTDFFMAGVWPVIIPSFISLAQNEENMFKSVATTKIIQRYGILDSVVHIEKGSRVATRNMLYDSETGDVLLTRTQNEFNDPVYNFTYPAHWAYNGMGAASQNINAMSYHLTIKNGKIISGLSMPDSTIFASGDELLVASKVKTDIDNAPGCKDSIATFPNYSKMWIVDANLMKGGPKQLFVIDEEGKSFTGNDVTLKVIRSGRRNIQASIGQVTMLNSPLVKTGNNYQLLINTDSRIINAGSVEYKQDWKVDNRNKQKWQCAGQ